MVRRVTTSSDSALPKMTRDEAHAVMREIGAAGNTDDPRYEQVRERVIEAFVNSAYPRVDEERAAKIFDVFRKNPALLPSTPPSV
jgi:hypothetical protein